MDLPSMYLGAWRPLDGSANALPFRLPAHHLVTHGVITGMTGSGKTGLVTVMVEEALRAEVPVLVIDVKGDLPNLLLTFPSFAPSELVPWADASAPATDARSPDAARGALAAAVSLLWRLLGRDPDPAKSREQVLLSVLAERRLAAGGNADLGALLEDLARPPIARIGALDLDAFVAKRDRRELAAALNTLLASPTFASWRQGTTLDVGAWMTPSEGRTPAAILSVAHLDDEERALVLGVLLEEVLSWVRSLPGSQRLRALVVFDEVYGFLPPHPQTPPTKRPIVPLMKQARASGVGVVVAKQHLMDIDYRALA